jgi:hypothetical protein
VRAQRVVVAEGFMRSQQQLGEIDQPRAPAGLFVGLVNFQVGARDRMVAGFDAFGPPTFILPGVDLPARLARRVARLVYAESRDDTLDQALLVVGIEDLEGFRQTRLPPMLAEQAVRNAVASISQPIRRVSTRVLPEPAPASTR